MEKEKSKIKNHKKIGYEIPKCELHIHIEGTIEPEYVIYLSKKNNIGNFNNLEELRERFIFKNLDDFLKILNDCLVVIIDEDDFEGLMDRYLRTAHSQGLVHAEIFFGAQHFKTINNISINTILNGYWKAIRKCEKDLGISADLIMCFDRALSEEDSFIVLDELEEYHKNLNNDNSNNKVKIIGLACSELDHPPKKHEKAFKKAGELGYYLVCHACEEHNVPLDYIVQAIEILKVKRIDHGVHCWKDQKIVDIIKKNNIPLTTCPLSGVYLKSFQDLSEFPLKQLLFENDLFITINSDDPSVFGGYIGENYYQLGKKFNLTLENYYTLACNSVKASFLPQEAKDSLLLKIKDYVEKYEE